MDKILFLVIKRVLFIVLLQLIIMTSYSQRYGDKNICTPIKTWNQEIIDCGRLSISTYVTKQEILLHNNQIQKEKTLSTLSKYRYELILVSNSKHNGKIVKTWLYNSKVFINGIEVTHDQFPEGFTALIDSNPTSIYWYETSDESINIEIKWKNSTFYNEK